MVALLFFATTINYVDRQVLGILAPTLQRELAWSETDYGRVVSWFSFAYGFGLLGMGRFLDRIGVRKGFTIAIITWSVAAMAHALARTAAGFAAARALLGLGEAGNFPGALKAVAAWFPARERALAVGLFNAGSNAGAIVAPLVVPWIALRWGWQAAFIATGALGFVWLAAWLALYREPDEQPRVSRAELEYIRSDGQAKSAHVPWRSLFTHRATWAFIVGKAMTDPVWLFYLFWLPKFLDAEWGVRLAGLAAPLIAIYLFADVGSIAGGWMSSALIARGWSVNGGRKAALSRGCTDGRADSSCSGRAEHVDRRVDHRARGRGASMVVVQPLHDGERRVPEIGRRFGHRHRRFCGRDERDVDAARDGTVA